LGRLESDWQALYSAWHRRSYLQTDPLILVLEQAPQDREAVAFLVSCLALGRVKAIQDFAKGLLTRLGSPVVPALLDLTPKQAEEVAGPSPYRFFSKSRLARWLLALGKVLKTHRTLENAFSLGVLRTQDPWERLEAFAALFHEEGDIGILVPKPEAGGAFKRLNLFLRWMVRHDEVDPGGWTVLSPRDLLVPVDTHVLAWAKGAGVTLRKQADRRACEEITAFFRTLEPEDPLRWDFSLTRSAMLGVDHSGL
jgi:uncharacterized protein (TIGR02757 family)